MPDFSSKAIHEFWARYEDPTIYKVIAFMETVETWTPDQSEEAEAALKELGKTLENIDNADLENEDPFIDILTFLRTGAGLRLLQCLDTANPGAASKILIYAEENSQNQDDAPSIFLRRNIVFERLRLLSRVFSKERLDLVQKAIEGE
jgi:intracellular multiplication protein IcmW